MPIYIHLGGMVTCPAPKEEPLGVDKRVDIFVPLTGL